MMFNLPNLLTLANLICGALGILAVIQGGPQEAFWWVILAVVFDYFDGFAARLLKVGGPMGKELDSLADMVSFGVLPGMIVYSMLKDGNPEWMSWAGFLIMAFSALRLAKFNVDERQTDTFIGLPTPSNTMFFASLPYVTIDWVTNPWTVIGLSILFSWFLVSEIRMFALKFKSFGIAKNYPKYLAILFAIVVVAIFQIEGIPLVILSYIIFSLVRGLILRQ